MYAKLEWNQKSLLFTQKQSHSDNLIGMCIHSPTTFLTSSQDSTVRLWDIRSQSSIKLIRNKCLSPELSNPSTDLTTSVFIGSQSMLYKFDMRKQQIFVEEVTAKIEEPHYDSINKVRYSQKFREVMCCDDEGDVRSYRAGDLAGVNRMEQHHVNICNCVEFVEVGAKGYEGRRMCVSGGFDSTLIVWDMEEEKPIKKVPIVDILTKHDIKIDNENYPFIHSISPINSSIVVGLQSGLILNLPILQPKKPKFILQASLTRITDCKVLKIHNKNLLISCANDDSFTIFDYEHREAGCPKFIQKYKTIAQPVQIQVLGNVLLVVGACKAMSFYEIKG